MIISTLIIVSLTLRNSVCFFHGIFCEQSRKWCISLDLIVVGLNIGLDLSLMCAICELKYRHTAHIPLSTSIASKKRGLWFCFWPDQIYTVGMCTQHQEVWPRNAIVGMSAAGKQNYL